MVPDLLTPHGKLAERCLELDAARNFDYQCLEYVVLGEVVRHIVFVRRYRRPMDGRSGLEDQQQRLVKFLEAMKSAGDNLVASLGSMNCPLPVWFVGRIVLAPHSLEFLSKNVSLHRLVSAEYLARPYPTAAKFGLSAGLGGSYLDDHCDMKSVQLYEKLLAHWPELTNFQDDPPHTLGMG